VKLSPRGLSLLFLVTQSVQFASEGHISAFTPLLLHDLGLSPSEVALWSGLLYAVMTGMAFPLAPFWGVLAERFSIKAVIVRSYFFMAAALLVAAWAPNVPTLIVSRMLIGLSFGTMGLLISLQALLVPRQRLGSSIATVQAAQPVASSLGPPLGALLIPAIGLRELFVVDACAAFAAGLSMLLLLPDPRVGVARGSVLGRIGEVLLFIWKTPPVRWNFTSAFLYRGASSVVDSYLPVRITQLAPDPAATIGWILGTYGLMCAAANWALGRFVDRANITRLYWQIMLVGCVVTLGMALSPWLWLLGLLAIARAVPVGWANILLHTHTGRIVPREQQTAVFSLNPFFRNSGALLFPLGAAALATFGPAVALGLAGLAYGANTLSGMKLASVSQGWSDADSESRREQPQKTETRPRGQPG
jgi:DHA1 family multidrug resistance protein-like MFS transporter